MNASLSESVVVIVNITWLMTMKLKIENKKPKTEQLLFWSSESKNWKHHTHELILLHRARGSSCSSQPRMWTWQWPWMSWLLASFHHDTWQFGSLQQQMKSWCVPNTMWRAVNPCAEDDERRCLQNSHWKDNQQCDAPSRTHKQKMCQKLKLGLFGKCAMWFQILLAHHKAPKAKFSNLQQLPEKSLGNLEHKWKLVLVKNVQKVVEVTHSSSRPVSVGGNEGTTHSRSHDTHFSHWCDQMWQETHDCLAENHESLLPQCKSTWDHFVTQKIVMDCEWWTFPFSPLHKRQTDCKSGCANVNQTTSLAKETEGPWSPNGWESGGLQNTKKQMLHAQFVHLWSHSATEVRRDDTQTFQKCAIQLWKIAFCGSNPAHVCSSHWVITGRTGLRSRWTLVWSATVSHADATKSNCNFHSTGIWHGVIRGFSVFEFTQAGLFLGLKATTLFDWLRILKGMPKLETWDFGWIWTMWDGVNDCQVSLFLPVAFLVFLFSICFRFLAHILTSITSIVKECNQWDKKNTASCCWHLLCRNWKQTLLKWLATYESPSF